MFPDWYVKLSYRICGEFSEKYFLGPFKDVHSDLKRAAIRLTLIEYLSLATFTSILVLFASFLVLSISLTVAIPLAIALLVGFIGSIFSATATFFIFYTYPSFRLDERKKRIDDMLPFATLYLATIAGSGTPAVGMFKTLSKFKEYGEISEEAARIVEETEIVGISIADALKNAANRTPSSRFKEILWGVMTTLLVGGDLKSFLHEKATTAMQEYRRRLQQFTQQVSMFMEMYLTVVIVGAIFFIVLSTIMGGIGGMPSLIVGVQLAITFVFLPVASAGFLVMLKGLAPAS